MEIKMYEKWDKFLRFLEKYDNNHKDHRKAAVIYILKKLRQEGKITNPQFNISEYPSCKEKPFPAMERYSFREDVVGKMAQEIVTDMDAAMSSCGDFSWLNDIDNEHKFVIIYQLFKALAELSFAYTFLEIIEQLDHIFNSLDQFTKYREQRA